MKSRMTSVWLPPDLAARLDALAERSAAGSGVRFSRSGWIVDAIRTALSNAENPALAAHRGRLAEAAALETEEGRP